MERGPARGIDKALAGPHSGYMSTSPTTTAPHTATIRCTDATRPLGIFWVTCPTCGLTSMEVTRKDAETVRDQHRNEA